VTALATIRSQLVVIKNVRRKYVSDGDAMVSTGVDSRDGNTVGDDRKSSK
jgi:hypothetical protein